MLVQDSQRSAVLLQLSHWGESLGASPATWYGLPGEFKGLNHKAYQRTIIWFDIFRLTDFQGISRSCGCHSPLPLPVSPPPMSWGHNSDNSVFSSIFGNPFYSFSVLSENCAQIRRLCSFAFSYREGNNLEIGGEGKGVVDGFWWMEFILILHEIYFTLRVSIFIYQKFTKTQLSYQKARWENTATIDGLLTCFLQIFKTEIAINSTAQHI